MSTKLDKWLEENCHGYSMLDEDERIIIKDFALMWSYFECFYLETEGGTKKILEFAEKVDDTSCHDLLDKIINYFRKRYVNSDGSPTRHFVYLNFFTYENGERVEKAPLQVRSVLFDGEEDYKLKLKAALLIIYRYRNNFSHGEKWLYDMKGQKENFEKSIELLQKLCEANYK